MRGRRLFVRDGDMAIVSSGALFDVLRQYNLLSYQQFTEALALAKGRCADVRQLAKTLIQKGWFTVFQMNQLLAGHGGELALGPYHILDRLGRGGQSEVYKARHIEYDWTVALKVIRIEMLATQQAADQFLQEMQAMAELDHPNIVQFLDADKAGDAYYCAMEFVDGTDLGKVVRLPRSLPPGQASEYMRQTAMGLQHAHENNLVHRDIKPVNLFLTTQPLPLRPPSSSGGPPPANRTPRAPLIKILDWGLANLQSSSGEREEEPKPGRPANLVGTADHLSPEQALHPNDVDIRADIYSLGCTFYYLLTGQTPFNGNTVMQKILQHQKAEPTPVEMLNAQVQPGLAAIIRRMLAKKPEDRFQTPAAVALALVPYCKGSWSPTMLPTNGPPRPAPDSDRPHDETPLPSATVDTLLPERPLSSHLSKRPPSSCLPQRPPSLNITKRP